MLMNDTSNTPYEPTIYYFLGGFDVYDREETLGEELNKYDPNDKNDLEYLTKKYIIEANQSISYRHKFLLTNVLSKALADESYDFDSVLNGDEDDYFSMPWDWDIKDPRVFFESIYRIIKSCWQNELEMAGKEDQSTW